MKVLTIVNHGTANSTAQTDLVINKLAEVLDGQEGTDWLLNEGAGTEAIFVRENPEKTHQSRFSKAVTATVTSVAKLVNSVAGVVAGKGVEDNVARSVAFVARQVAIHGAGAGDIQVNLAGHSRGSITCYKIARALHDDIVTRDIKVNIFAIDPVPGNMGTLNQANYKNIALGGNIDKTILMLAESEHRLAFRPYVDALYSIGLDNHKLETVPGTHGGINELAGTEKESAHLVMSRAVEFLHANSTPLKNWFDMWVMSESAKLETYAKLMRKIKKYQRDASLWNPGNLISGALQVDRQRTAMVQGPKAVWGIGNPGAANGNGNANANANANANPVQPGRADHHGLKLNEALARGHTLPDQQTVHATRPNRFFANLEHQSLFTAAYPNLIADFLLLERGVDGGRQQTICRRLPDAWKDASIGMSMPEREYGARWLAMRGCPVTVH